MNATRTWSSIGIFMIMLVVSLPFYSANVLAANVQITKNQGEAGIEQFLNAKGDVWAVEAVISGSPIPVEVGDVKIKIGSNKADFQTCGDGPLGPTCQYLSPLTDGIREGEHDFQVIYEFLDIFGQLDDSSTGDIIRADGSPPEIIDFSLEQKADDTGVQQVFMDFTVKDKINPDAPSVGISAIEVIEVESGTVLQTIQVPNRRVAEFNYKRDTDFNGILQASFKGEGLIRLGLRAEDYLGHKTERPRIETLKTDFTPPRILDKTLNFTALGKFIGVRDVLTDIKVDIVDPHLDPGQVFAVSEQASLNGQNGDCTIDPVEDDLWHCIWKQVEVQGSPTISIFIGASDTFGNVVERAISNARPFTQDENFPTVKFFGTTRTFDSGTGEMSYAQNGESVVVIEVKKEGALMDADGSGIRANLAALGGTENMVPTKCTQEGSSFSCFWEGLSKTFSSEGLVQIFLNTVEDSVGNEAEGAQFPVKIDNSPPIVEKIELFGVSDRDKDFFQSGDQIKIKFTATESSGITVLADLTGVDNDAEAKYPEHHVARSLPLREGLRVFTQDDGCVKREGKWECEFLTDPIRSGFASNVKLKLEIQDTAGNPAVEYRREPRNTKPGGVEGNYKIDILGLSGEESPDYWGVKRGYPKKTLPFIDLDTVALIPTRMPMQVKFDSETANARVLSMEALPDSCTAENAPRVSRLLLHGGKSTDSGEAAGTLVLELAPFDNAYDLFAILDKKDFDGITVDYTCQVRIFSQVGKEALQAAEIQDIKLPVKFAFTSLGAVDENVADKIKEVRDSGSYKFLYVAGYLNTAIQWIKWVVNFFTVLQTALSLMALFQDSFKISGEKAENTIIGAGWGAALRGACFSMELGTEGMWEYISYLQIPAQILACNPDPGIDLGAPGQWQRTVLKAYNWLSGRGPLGIGATSLYDNLYTSALGLCVPGLIYQAEKAREIHCRKIICYANEVSSGIATMQACDELYDLLMCEFVWGPFFDFVGFGGLSALGKMIKSAFTSPLGLISLTEVFACGLVCFVKSPTLADAGSSVAVCKFAQGFNKILSMVNAIISSIDNTPSVTASPYCKTADAIDLKKLAPVGNPEPPATSAPPAGAAPPVTGTPGPGQAGLPEVAATPGGPPATTPAPEVQI